jgi:N4-(beta-N-acetylglucosaminyl)-L-asparaginase
MPLIQLCAADSFDRCHFTSEIIARMGRTWFVTAYLILGGGVSLTRSERFVINTWSGVFEDATAEAYRTLTAGGSALDAVENGCKVCEAEQCDTSVGYGNHPDTKSHTSLDAMIMDGDTFDVGSVGYIRKYRDVISIARYVMVYTAQTLLVGEGAEEFAEMMGFVEQSATTDNSIQVYDDWKAANCQPNFYENIPAATTQCGPYNITQAPPSPSARHELPSSTTTHRTTLRGGGEHLWAANRENHDTIGLVAIDAAGSFACGTSTNGANHKVAGRLGDSPITGAGCYADSNTGGCAATGDGDVMMRFLPSFYAVTLMEAGRNPNDASAAAIQRITKVFPTFSGAVVCVNKAGVHGAAANNMSFEYSYASDSSNGVQVVTVA